MTIGSNIIRKKSLPNSMEYAKECLDSLPHGTAIITDYLETARGRQGRTWRVDQGQLLLTLVLKPTQQSPNLSSFIMALACGVACGLSEYNVALKWPNDFIVNGKKLGGILTESIWQGSQLKGVIVGIALNINNRFERTDELYDHATSLRDVVGSVIDKDACLNVLVAEMNKVYAKWEKGDHVKIFEQWKNKQAFLGKKIIVHNTDGKKVSGVMKNVIPSGDMVLSVSEKHNEVIPFYLAWEIFMV